MDRRYANRLLREAVEEPRKLLTREKFWKLKLWPYYLEHCNEMLFSDPHSALAFTRPAPKLAGKIAQASPGSNGADLMLLAYSYLGSAYRGSDDYDRAEAAFNRAQGYKKSASPKALAEHLRRLAYLRIVQRRPEAFRLIGEAIAIHKCGSLVHRHALGECLLCRGHAYYDFGQPGKSLEDFSAALNHVSIKIDPKTYYSTLHNLAGWAVDHGTDEELRAALTNLRPALTLLNTCWTCRHAKLKLRWLIGVVDARLGAQGRAELVYLEVRSGLVDLGLAYEVGMLQVDLALLYLAQGRHAELQALAGETIAIFRRLGVEPKVREVLDIWRRCASPTEAQLKHVRRLFASHAAPMPDLAASGTHYRRSFPPIRQAELLPGQ